MAEENLTIQFWSADVLPEKVTSCNTGSSDEAVHLKMACFGEHVNDNTRTVLYCDSNDRKSVICVLSNQNENQALDLVFAGNACPKFTVRGKNPSKVHLSGFIQPLIDADDLEIDAPSAQLDTTQPNEMEYEPVNKTDDATNLTSSPVLASLSNSKKRPAEDMEELEPPKKKQKTEEPEPEDPPAPTETVPEVTNEDNNEKAPAVEPTEKTDTPRTPEVAEETNNKPEKKKKKKKKKKFTYTKSGLGMRELKQGSGAKAKKGSEIRVKYILQLDGTSTIVDKNLGEGFVFVIGAGDVIKGWDEGCLGLQEGSKRKLKVPPSLGYGSQGSGDIPPNATLNFTIECISVDRED